MQKTYQLVFDIQSWTMVSGYMIPLPNYSHPCMLRALEGNLANGHHVMVITWPETMIVYPKPCGWYYQDTSLRSWYLKYYIDIILIGVWGTPDLFTWDVYLDQLGMFCLVPLHRVYSTLARLWEPVLLKQTWVSWTAFYPSITSSDTIH